MYQGHLLIVWSELNQTGVPILDEQHRGIVSIINSLHYSVANERGRDFLAPAADMIMDYTRIHFATEIDLLEQAGYPDLEAHRQLHDKLITVARAKAFESRKAADPHIYLDFLKSWWINHINREDLKYRTHLGRYLWPMADHYQI